MSTGFVYVGYDRNGLFKIGRTDIHYDKRKKQIQNMNPAFDIFISIQTKDSVELEKELHERFGSKRIVGEWFKLIPDDIQSLIYEYNGVDVQIEEVERNWAYYVGQDLF